MFLHIEQRISNKNRRQIGFWNRDLNSFIFFYYFGIGLRGWLSGGRGTKQDTLAFVIKIAA